MSELLPGENLVLKTHQHWIVLVKALVIPVVLLIVPAVVDFTVKSGTGIPHFRTIVTLTDQRIKIESGVFGRASKIIPIDRIQDCTTKQTLFGRMLGYGRVEVDAAGAQGAEVLDHLPQPGTFRDQVFVQSERRRGGAPSAPAPVNPSGV